MDEEVVPIKVTTVPDKIRWDDVRMLVFDENRMVVLINDDKHVFEFESREKMEVALQALVDRENTLRSLLVDARPGSPEEKLIARSFNISELRLLMEQSAFRQAIEQMYTLEEGVRVVQLGEKILHELNRRSPDS